MRRFSSQTGPSPNGNGHHHEPSARRDAVEAALETERPSRHPWRDVPHHPAVRFLSRVWGSWAVPELAEDRARSFGGEADVLEPEVALGEHGLVEGHEDAVTDLRTGVLTAEEEQALQSPLTTLRTTTTREHIEVARGAAAGDEKERVDDDDIPVLKERLTRARELTRERRAQADAAEAEVLAGDVVERNPLPMEKLVVAALAEVIASAFLLADKVAELIATPIPVLGPIVLAMLVALVLSASALTVGAMIAYVLPRKAGAAALLVLAAAVVWQLAGSIEDLRLGDPDRGPLVFAHLQLLLMVATAFAGWALLPNWHFAPIRRRAVEAHAALEASVAEEAELEAALHAACERSAQLARTAAETPLRVLEQRRSGEEAAVAAEQARRVYAGLREAELGHGAIRKAIAELTYRVFRNERPDEVAGAGEAQSEPVIAEWALTLACALLGLGGVLTLVVGAALAAAAGAFAAALILALDAFRRPARRPPRPLEVEPGAVRPLGQSRHPWVRMPRRFSGGRGTQDSTSTQI